MDAMLIDGLNAMHDGIDTGFDEMLGGPGAWDMRLATDDELDQLVGELERGWIN